MARINQSGQKIIDALLLLMDQKEYEEISISEITRIANVSRISFYRNYNTKEEVIDTFIHEVIGDVEDTVNRYGTIKSLQEYFLILFKTTAKYGHVVRQIYNAHLSELILACFNEKLFRRPTSDNQISFDRYQAKFYTGAFYNVYIEWVLSGQRESADEMAELCSSLIA